MKDFDFEELDRAVSSAIGGNSNDRNPTPPERTAPTPAARRSSPGRFMDIKPAAADSRTPEARPSAPPVQQTPAPQVTQPQPQPTPATEDVKPFDFQPEPKVQPSTVETPFISDAVVEKRPLGGPAATGASIQDELLKAEKIENSLPSQSAPSDDYVPPASTPVSPLHSSQGTEEAAPRSIYDTEAFTQPPVAKKKKSALWIVLWVALLVLLGAGAGAAVYFFVLQPL